MKLQTSSLCGKAKEFHSVENENERRQRRRQPDRLGKDIHEQVNKPMTKMFLEPETIKFEGSPYVI